MNADFVRTARSKGMSERRVVHWHVLRNALVLVLTTVGLQFGALMGQAVVVEKLFSWPGLGSLLVDSVFQRDIPAVQGCILVIVLFFLVINTLVDLAYARDRSAHPIRLSVHEAARQPPRSAARCSRSSIVVGRARAVARATPIRCMDANLMNAEDAARRGVLVRHRRAGPRHLFPRRLRRAHLAHGRHRLAAHQQLIGVALGLTAGYWGGWWDDFVSGLTNLMLAIPSLIFALAIMAILAPGPDQPADRARPHQLVLSPAGSPAPRRCR